MIGLLSKTKEYRMTVGQLMEKTKRKTLPEFVRWRAAIVTKDLVRLTPPRIGRGVGSFADQKKAGERSVEKDIKKLFKPLEELNVIQHPENESLGRAFKRLIALQDYAKLEVLLNRLGTRFRGIIAEANESTHERHRTGPKRHVARGIRYAVLRAASIVELIAKKVRDVGKLKAGWMTAVTRLGVKGIPKWVSRHSVPGQCIDQSRLSKNPFVYVQNDSPAAKDQNPNEIVEFAVEMNHAKMRKELEAILRWEFKKASAR